MFYQDAHAKIVFKMFGVLFMIGAIVFAAFSIYTPVANGPNWVRWSNRTGVPVF